MLWIKTEEGHYQAGEFTIYLRKHYYYELVHNTDGTIHKYRLLDGAKRAADRLLIGQKSDVTEAERKGGEKRIKAALQFQQPLNK